MCVHVLRKSRKMLNSQKGLLISYTSGYKYADITRRDIKAVFDQYKDLRPSYGPFIFNDGSQKNLLNIDGTIPVSYHGSVYNIPISIFLLDTHPYNSPIVYVKPTYTMELLPNEYMDDNGKLDLPYLREWRYPQSDLLGLIAILVVAFSDVPPVFSKTVYKDPADVTQQKQLISTECPSKWKVDDVCEFIKAIPEYVSYVEQFRAEKIDGEALFQLDKRDLREVFGMPLGLAIKILTIVDRMKKATNI